MSPGRIRAHSNGFSVLEVLLVTSIVATLAAVSIPVTAGALDELRTSMAARYLEGRIMNARATAVRRSTRIGLRFEPVGNDWRIGEYSDGNAMGSVPPISRRASMRKSPRPNSSAVCFLASDSACTAACRTSTARARAAPTVFE
jgi:Tfp pilus assembly protein FimT